MPEVLFHLNLVIAHLCFQMAARKMMAMSGFLGELLICPPS